MARITRLMAIGLVALLVMPLAASAGNGNGGGQGHRSYNYDDPEHACTRDNPEGEEDEEFGTWQYTGAQYLWPPNHKMDDGNFLTFTAAEEDTDIDVIYRVGHDQYVDGEELNGSGNTPGDSDITANGSNGLIMDGQDDDGSAGLNTLAHEVLIRAERSGRDKTGRTYYINGESPLPEDVDGDGNPLAFGVTFTKSDGDSETCTFAYEICVPHDQGQASACTSSEEEVEALLAAF